MDTLDVSGVINTIDPTAPVITAAQQAVSSAGGGLGSVALSVPSFGQYFADTLNYIRDTGKSSFNYLISKSPSGVAKANSEAKDNTKKPTEKTTTEKVEASVSLFFSSLFTQTMYIIFFVFGLIICILGSSIAANNIGPGQSKLYYIYYMIYGFIITAIPLFIGGMLALNEGKTTAESIGFMTGGFLFSFIPMGILIYRARANSRPIWYAYLAPMYPTNSAVNVFSYNPRYSNINIRSQLSATRSSFGSRFPPNPFKRGPIQGGQESITEPIITNNTI